MRKSDDQSVHAITESQLFLSSAKFEVATLATLENPIVRCGVDYWLSLCGTKRFPARDAVNLREIKTALSHMMLIEVIAGGADFEFRVVGDSIASALRFPVHKRRLSDIGSDAPVFVERNAGFYRRVVESCGPLAIRSRFGLNSPELKSTHVEAAILPLGSRDDVVDHLLAFANYVSQLD